MAKKKDEAENPRAVFGGNSQAADQMKSFIERIERLMEDKAELQADIKDVFAEAKGNGFDVKALREIIKLRKQDHAERQEFEAIVDLYKSALNMD